MTNLQQKAAALIERHGMVNTGDKILCAFSGGSDSSALLHFLVSEYGTENVYAAHLNHQIRVKGGEADSDERFAAETCRKYGVRIFTERRNVPEIAKKFKKTAEEAGREARYDFFARVCSEIAEIGGSVKIATAHIMPDNTESVLMNIARGSGTAGLCGIAPVYNNIIRPLLTCGKRDILEYCRGNNIDFTEDKTNSDEIYARNFMRHSVAAKIKERYAGLDGSIMRMSEIMRDTNDFIDLQAENILNILANGGIPVGVYIAQHKAVRRAVIIKMCGNAGGRIDFNLVEELDRAVLAGKLVRQDLPGNTAAEVKKGVFRIFREDKDYRLHRKAQKNRKKD
jgi:tRNA(Ile)-lysidine synthase